MLFQKLSHNIDATLPTIFLVLPLNAFPYSPLFLVRPKVPQSTVMISIRMSGEFTAEVGVCPEQENQVHPHLCWGGIEITLLHTAFRGRWGNLAVLV